MTIGEYLFTAAIETLSLKIRSLHYSPGHIKNYPFGSTNPFLGGTFVGNARKLNTFDGEK